MKRNEWLDGRELAKIGFLRCLLKTGQLRTLKVFPMLTGIAFTEGEWANYADMLGVAPAELLNRASFAHQIDYFALAQCFPDSDVFADAGTGIADEGQKVTSEHVNIQEVRALLPIGSNRILIVFQSRPDHNHESFAGAVCKKGEKFRIAMQAKLRRLSAAGLRCFAYYDASVNFVLISRSKDRVDAMLRALRDVLRMPERHIVRSDSDGGVSSEQAA